MYFSKATASAVLAFVAVVYGAPAYGNNNTTAPTTTTTTPPKPSDTGLSLTQKLFIADTAADRFALLPKNEDFKFDFIKNTPEAVAKNGGLVTANRKTFPALVTSGGSMALGKIKPCTMNTLHVHPRGAELQYLIKGKLMVQMIPENAVQVNGKPRVITNTLEPGQATIFYQGSVHTQANFECEEAEFMAFFPNEEAGAGSVAQEFFAADQTIVANTISADTDPKSIAAIRDQIPASFLAKLTACAAKCKPKKA